MESAINKIGSVIGTEVISDVLAEIIKEYWLWEVLRSSWSDVGDTQGVLYAESSDGELPGKGTDLSQIPLQILIKCFDSTVIFDLEIVQEMVIN